MVSQVQGIALEGVEARLITVECAATPGLPGFSIVGLPAKAISEARDRIRSAFATLTIALPPKRITVNLVPADLPKDGAHFDLPIALALLCEMGVLSAEHVQETLAIGELSLDGKLRGGRGALCAALTAAEHGLTLVCPTAVSADAAWVGDARVIGADDLGSLIAHFVGRKILEIASPARSQTPKKYADLRDVKGQLRAKRALEIAAAGRHHMIMIGPPGAGKSMLASRLGGILPEMTPYEAFETAQVQSVYRDLGKDGISLNRPFRSPHHSASAAAIVGGGRAAMPGEISLAHNGVLFLDEFPEFASNVLDGLRQPLETGQVSVSRASAHVYYPCRFLLIAAANPCKCGYFADANRACSRAPICSEDYLNRISGPLWDRFDLRLEITSLSYDDLNLPATGERSEEVLTRVLAARAIQTKRYEAFSEVETNSDIEGEVLDQFATPDDEGRELLMKASEKFSLTARGFHRILRVARTIADLAGSEAVSQKHIAEALSFRIVSRKNN